MKSAPDSFKEYLQANNTFIMADLYEFRLKDATTILRYTTADINITVGSRCYLASGPLISRSNIRMVLGVETDTLNLEVVPRPTDTLLGITWLQAAVAGALDGADVTLSRAFLDDSLNIVGEVVLFFGQVAEIQSTRSSVKVTVNSPLFLLNIKMPRRVWQAGCLHTLYSADCGVNRATKAVTATVGLGSSDTLLRCGLSNPKEYFSQGYVEFISGDLSGVRRTVRSYTPGSLNLLVPLPSIPVAGATFTAYPGCDKTMATCAAKFGNLPHFLGFPFIPEAERAI
ncbi:MAG: DUF2163 domain-containing protein [Magnetococcales bacterium]|nr:DUF2163 domain-containing protein [Magnetococcales bacterium]